MFISVKRYFRKQNLRRDSIAILILFFSSIVFSYSQQEPLQWFLDGTIIGAFAQPANDPFTATLSFNAAASIGARTTVSSSLSIGGSAGYQWMPGIMRYDESVVLSIEDDPVPATIRHNKSVGLGLVFLEPFGAFTIPGWTFQLGARIGYVIDGGTEITQQIIDPPGVRFSGGDIITDYAGEYPGLTSIAVWTTIGVHTKGQRIGSFRFEPGITLTLPITSMSSTDPFRMWSAGFSIRVISDPLPEPSVRVDSTFITDTIVVESLTETQSSEFITVIGIDSLIERSESETYIQYTVRQRLTKTISIGVPLLLTEARAQFVDANGRLSERTNVRVTTDRHELRAVIPASVSYDVVRHDIAVRSEGIKDLVDAAFKAMQLISLRPNTNTSYITEPIHWTVEHWDSCRVRFDLVAGGDAEPVSWKLVVRDPMRHIVDSIGGNGAPPISIERALRDTVLMTVRNGGTLTFEFSACGDDGRWTLPVYGSLVFESVSENPGDAYEWQMSLPESLEMQPMQTSNSWNDVQKSKIEQQSERWAPILLRSSIKEVH